MAEPDVAALDRDHVWHPYTETSEYAREQLVVVGAEGCWVYDSDGRRYVDAISGLWNVQIGYGVEAVVRAATDQLAELPYQPLNGRTHAPAARLAGRLAELAPGELTRVFYASGGAEANETAIKMARQFWRQNGRPSRYKIVGLSRGWHGCTLGALAVGGVAEEQNPFEPLGVGFPKIPAPDCFRCALGLSYPECSVACARALEAVILQEGEDTVAGVLAEPILGLAGMIPPVADFWHELAAICRRYDLLLIVDEVAMGFGRTGRMFASEHYHLEPDILTCAKGITSAYLPLAAVLTTERVHDAFVGEGRAFVHGYTFGGHPAACAAALANLDVIESRDLCRRAETLGAELLERMRASLADCPVVGEVRGLGLAIAVDLVRDRGTREPLRIAADLCAALRRDGVLARPLGDGNVLPFVPPLVIPAEVARETADAYCDAVWSAARHAKRSMEAVP